MLAILFVPANINLFCRGYYFFVAQSPGFFGFMFSRVAKLHCELQLIHPISYEWSNRHRNRRMDTIVLAGLFKLFCTLYITPSPAAGLGGGG